ncbi:MAG: hypothetical protein R2875_14060 [Desulfobacterales bacterium]
MFFGISELEAIDPPKLENLNLRAPRFKLPASIDSFCVDMDFDRAGHTYGKSYQDVVRGMNGQFENPPDYVAYPEKEDDIIELMKFL